MSPPSQWHRDVSESFPRVSGDEPITQAVARDVLGFSPRERG